MDRMPAISGKNTRSAINGSGRACPMPTSTAKSVSTVRRGGRHYPAGSSRWSTPIRDERGGPGRLGRRRAAAVYRLAVGAIGASTMEHGTSTSELWRFGLNGEQVPSDHRWAVYETRRGCAPDRWDRIAYSARTRAECE